MHLSKYCLCSPAFATDCPNPPHKKVNRIKPLVAMLNFNNINVVLNEHVMWPAASVIMRLVQKE